MSTQPAIVIRRTTDTVLELMSGPLALSNGQWGLAKGDGKLVCRDDGGEFHEFVDVAGLSNAIVNLSFARAPVANRMALPTTDPIGATRMTLDTRKIYKRIQSGGWQDIVEDAGRVNLYGGVTSVPPPSFTHLGNGQVSIPSCTVALYDNEFYVGFPREYVIPGKTLRLTEGLSQYVVAYYNAGTPEYQITLNDRDFDFSWRIPVMRLWYAGGEVHSASCDSLGVGLPEKLADRVTATDFYARRDGEGLILSVDAGRHPLVTSSYVFAGAAEVDVQAYNGNTDKLTEAVWNGTTYVFNTVSGGAISNAQYQGTSGTVVLGTGKYAAHWIYRSIGDVKECFILYGRDQYSNLAEAQQASPYMGPLPTIITDHCMLVGRVVVQQGSQTTYVTIPFTSQFAGVAVTAHNNLAGLNTGDYQHLTAAQLTALTTGVSTTQHKHDAAGIVNTPAGNIAATTVQAAINELDSEKQPVDPTLTAMAGVATAADRIIYFTGTDAATYTTLSAYGRSLIDDADATTARGTLSVYSKAETDAKYELKHIDSTAWNQDFDSFTSEGKYIVTNWQGNGATNGPTLPDGTKAYAYGYLEVERVTDSSPGMILQRFTANGGTGTANGGVWYRTKYSSNAWSSWRVVYDYQYNDAKYADSTEAVMKNNTALQTMTGGLRASLASSLTTTSISAFDAKHTSSGTAGAGFGVSYDFYLADTANPTGFQAGAVEAVAEGSLSALMNSRLEFAVAVTGVPTKRATLNSAGTFDALNLSENGTTLTNKYQPLLNKGGLDTCTANWNNYTTNGVYKVEPSTGSWVTAWAGTGTNGPVEAYPWGVLVVSYGNSSGILQTYTVHRSPGLLEGGIWYRTYVNGSWTADWKHVPDIDYLDTIYAPTTHQHAVSDIVDITNNYVSKSSSSQQIMNGSLMSYGIVSSSRTNTTHTCLAAQISGDAYPRFVVLADGKLQWGSGAATQDTDLYRIGADSLGTSDSFTAYAGLSSYRGTTDAGLTLGLLSGGDTIRVLCSGSLAWSSAGGAVDTNLYRNGTNALRTDGELTLGGNLVVVGSIIQGGTNLTDKYQGKDPTLTAMAGVATAADRIIYFTGTDAATYTTLSAFGRSLIDDANAATALGTLGAAPTSHASSATTYGVGSASNYGHVKLYTGTGTATDGTMDQNSIKTALDAKASLGGASFTGAISASQCVTTAECGGGYLIQSDSWETVTYSTATATHTPTGGNTRIELTYAGPVQLTINAPGAGAFNGTHVYLTVKGTYGYSASVTIFIKSVYGGTVTVSTTSTKLMHLHLVSNGVSGWFLTSAET